MSRVRLPAKNPAHEIIVGSDHACGYFIQIFNGVDEEGEDVLLLDQDSLLGGLTRESLINHIDEYVEDSDIKESVCYAIRMNLQILEGRYNV
ncbi:MAG: hypothetical protein KKC03_13595 [Bacteroidetes bacterium]|nr:hypothetical protein [Bacteroidota bacterium]